jgi:hypothetical protein
LKEQYVGKIGVGKPGLKYIKQVDKNREADSYRQTKRMAYKQLQIKKCKPIRKFRDKTSKKIRINISKK